MAGYWPSSFLLEKRTRPICSHLERISLVNKRFTCSIWIKLLFYCGTQRVIPKGQDSAILLFCNCFVCQCSLSLRVKVGRSENKNTALKSGFYLRFQTTVNNWVYRAIRMGNKISERP